MLRRIEIISVKRDPENKSAVKAILAFLVDDGRLESLEKPSVWKLPIEFGEDKFPRQACKVMMVGLKPQGREKTFFLITHFLKDTVLRKPTKFPGFLMPGINQWFHPDPG